jgi:serine/threonine protein kinase/tetratricopeptide (TPR) repeat protein
VIGQTLGHYRVLEQIGAGGMGVVYRAHDERLDRDVALKVLPAGTLADEAARKRFRKEALTLSKLNHPNIETVHDFDTQDGADFLVMELIPGITLDQKLLAGALPEKELLRLGQQLAEGLAAAHAEAVIHCDLKPGNLRLTPDGRLKILDFGLAKLLQPASVTALTESLSQAHDTVTGTLPYMAPEQLRGEPADARADIWAAGAVLYEMATGRRPFDAKISTALAGDILHKPPPSPRQLKPELSPKLEDITLKCLEKDPDDRYQSARELAVDLRRLAAPASTAVVAVAPPTRRSWKFATAASFALLVALMAAVAILNPAGLRDRLLGRNARSQIKSIAVLPLENLSRDPEQDYFADGMTDALIAGLAQINSLKVISHTSMMQYKGTRKPLPQVGQELGIDAVIEGSVLRAGDRVRITVKLVETATDRHLWARTYERELREVLKLQDEVARAIADEVSASLTPQETVRLASARALNPEALDLYLKGRYQENDVSIEGFNRAIEYFRGAIGRDPNFAPAYAGLAESYHALAVFGGGPPRELYPKAKEAAAKSLELDVTLSDAHISQGLIKTFYEWDWPGAEAEFKRALQLKPSSAEGHHLYFLYLTGMMRLHEASREIEQARALDPLNVAFNRNSARLTWMMGNFDQAIEHYREILKRNPNFISAHRELGYVFAQKGMMAAAIDEELKAVSLSRDPYTLASLGRVYAIAGKRNEALKVLAELQEQSKRSYVAAFHIAEIYAALDQKEDALRFLEKAYQEHHPYLLWLRWYPSFDTLRSEPRFQDLVRRMNFPP